MKIGNLTEDVLSDFSYREIINKIYNSLMNEIKNNGLDSFTKKRMKFKKGTRTSYWIHTSILTPMLYKENDVSLYIIITEPIDDQTFGAFSKDLQGLMIFTNLENIDSHEKGHIPIWEKSKLKSVFMHEMTHYFDYKRSQENKEWNAGNDEDMKDYINSNVEKNAFYQQMIHDIEEFIEKAKSSNNYDKIYKLFFTTPEKFINFAFGRLDTEVIENMSDNTKKTFKKRLYQYYDEMFKE